MNKGLFIVLYGPGGVGKKSQAGMLEEKLRGMGVLCRKVRYPVYTAGESGKKLDTILSIDPKKIAEKTGYKKKIVPHFPPNYPPRPVVEEFLSIDSGKARKKLGWVPRYSLDAGLDEIIAYWKTRG